MLDFEVAELTWENGHLSEHGLVPTAIYPSNVTGTLECIVNQAKLLHDQFHAADAIVPRLSTHHRQQNEKRMSRIGSCDNMEQRNKRTRKKRLADDNTLASAVGSRNNNTCSINDFGFAPSNSIDRSPETENTSLNGGGGSRQVTMVDDHDTACHSIMSQSEREMCGEEDRKVTEGAAVRSNVSTKKGRSAAIHNQSERKRRYKINQKMRTLQKLVPRSSKTDKASMLDEVIEYLKQLQAQVGMMSKMGGMMMPIGMQQFQMAMMAQMTQMAQMSSMGIMDLSTLSRVGQSMGVSPMFLATVCMPMMGVWDPSADCMQHPAGGVGPDPFSPFVVCPPQQPMTMDAHQRMAALYQQMFQQNQPTNQN